MTFLRSCPKLGIFTVFIILVAYNLVNKIDFQEIDQLILENEPIQPNNFAVPILGTDFIQLKSEERIDTQKNKIKVAIDNSQLSGRSSVFETTIFPSDFLPEKVPVMLSMINKSNDIFSNWDTLRLNFYAPINWYFPLKTKPIMELMDKITIQAFFYS